MNADFLKSNETSQAQDSRPPQESDPMRILIIDDNREIHDDFSKILCRVPNAGFEMAGAELFDRKASPGRRLRFTLDSASQGSEGYDLVRRAIAAGQKYALAFLDMRMPPGWDGVETATRLWQVDPDLQIVICTAYSDHSWKSIVARLGHQDSLLILKKPFDPVEILQLAHALTRKWQLARLNTLRVAGLETSVAERTVELHAANQKLRDEIAESQRNLARINLQFSALSAAANAIVIADHQGTIEWVNPAYTKLTGYSAAEAIGRSLRAPAAGHQPPAYYASRWDTLAAGKVWRAELVERGKDGRFFTMDLTITPVFNAAGDLTHFVAIKQDITERLLLEKRLQQVQKLEAIGTLAGGIAHDFNNILSVIFGYGHLLEGHVAENPPARADIRQILKAADRAKDLVQQILTFSHPRGHKHQVTRLEPVIQEAARFLRASLPGHIQFEIDLHNNAPAVLADPTQMYQVTLNLITNAKHALAGRPGRLAVALASFLPDAAFLANHPKCLPASHARLTVSDTGQGMDAETLDRIFEPFFTTKPAGEGTGLGLAVVHGIVQSHGGIIAVESQVGQGTTFHIYLPAHESPDASAQAESR